MELKRLKVCEEADLRLRILKARTGLTPNLLCRLGFCLSLNDPTPPDPAQYPEDGPREINRYTLTGQWDRLFVALLKERCHCDGFGDGELDEQFRAHVNRGVLLLYKRVRSLNELALPLLGSNIGEDDVATQLALLSSHSNTGRLESKE